MPLQIERMSLDEIKAYPNNAKIHTAEQIEQIKESIRSFGFNDPIAIWHNEIVEGHGRFIAAQELGFKEIDVIKLDELSDEQRRAYMLVHNKLTMNTGFDMELLEFELENIDMDMEQFGFDVDVFGLADNDDVIEDDVPEKVETRCKTGDLWQLGNNRLVCGDSTDPAVIDRLMDGVKADMVFTDPPYGMKYTIHRPKEEVRFEMIQNDDKILDFFPCVERYSNGFVFVCTTWKVLDEWLPLFKKYFDLSNMIIWNKGGGGIGDLKTTFSVDYEIILCASRKNRIVGKRIGSVWDCGRDNAVDYQHPTQKPVGLSSIAIEHTTNKGQIVLDCFGGSGSTLIACEQLNRKCYMCELDPHYCDVIIQRWENFTGEKAIKL